MVLISLMKVYDNRKLIIFSDLIQHSQSNRSLILAEEKRNVLLMIKVKDEWLKIKALMPAFNSDKSPKF